MDPSSPSLRTTTDSPVGLAGTAVIAVEVDRHPLIESFGRLFLAAHPDGSERDWRRCGTTCPDVQCRAISQAAGAQCPKKASIQLVVPATSGLTLPLCGGHFTVHRSGKDLELAL